MKAVYRQEYDGEFVVDTTFLSAGFKNQKREWAPNPIVNQHISGRAAVIGSAIDQELFNFRKLQNHKGGLQGKKRLQTYATGDIWQEMRCDFFVSVDQVQIGRIVPQKYYEKNIVYTSIKLCLNNPGNFYMIPLQPPLSDLAYAAYLAAFDGHQEIFLLGYNKETPNGNKNWQHHVYEVMSAYSAQQFRLVGIASNMPDEWRFLPNVDCMTYKQFITYCDV